MNLIPEILAAHAELTAWRRDFHAHPELGFAETRTSDFVTKQLSSWGIKVTRGIGKTGLVGTLKAGTSNKAIGLRADMDALPMDELNTFDHKSQHSGCMHGCGHDGHTVMLLAAARYLAQSKTFNGTVQFIFQPAEEANPHGSGAKAMIDDGLFERFPMDNIFALHNSPGILAGAIATCSGPMMASTDLFDVTITGKGTHGAFPSGGNDPLVIAAQMITAWQTIISRNIDAMDHALISATSINAGNNSWNVIPETAVIRGCVRALSPEIRQQLHDRFHTITQSIAKAFDAKVDINYRSIYPVVVNDAEQTTFVCDVAADIFGEHCVLRERPGQMGSEDFAYMLQKKPGCYFAIGATTPSKDRKGFVGKDIKKTSDLDHFLAGDVPMLHAPTYDFNDDILPLGATMFARLAEHYLNLSS